MISIANFEKQEDQFFQQFDAISGKLLKRFEGYNVKVFNNDCGSYPVGSLKSH